MTHRTLDYEERLRAALRAAAESVEPGGDGLEKIRSRVQAPRHAPAAWLTSGAEPFGRRLWTAVLDWLRPPAHGAPSAQRWLRPAAAMAAFVLVVGTGALALTRGLATTAAPTGFGSTGSALQTSRGNGGGTNGNGSPLNNGGGPSVAPPSHGSVPTSTTAGSPSGQAPSPPKPTPSCPSSSKTPGPSASASPPVSSSPSPTETPSPSPSPTPSGTTSPSPTDSSAAPTGSSSTTPPTGSSSTTPPTTDAVGDAPLGSSPPGNPKAAPTPTSSGSGATTPAPKPSAPSCDR